jgi:hypothetical protein
MLNRTLMLLSPDATDGGGTGTATVEGAGESGEQLFEGAGADSGEVASAGEADAGETGAAAEVAGASAADVPTSLTKDDIASILREAGIGTQPAAKAQPEAKTPPTQDELEKMFNVWKPSAELIAQLRAEKPEDAVAAIVAMRDGMLKQVMTMVEFRTKQIMDKLQADNIAPLQQYVSEAQATSFRNDFFVKYPDLNKYEALVDAVAAKLQQSGFHADNRDAVMAKFAEETQKVVTQLTGGQAAAGANNGKGGKAAATSGKGKMSTLSTGGAATAGKGGSGGGTAAKGPPGIEIFD